jgi:LPXTG-site transpeptidase (sortase) family protein
MDALGPARRSGRCSRTRINLYVVVETKTVTPDAVDVLDPTDKAMVTMITCVPDGIYSHRLIVRAEAV